VRIVHALSTHIASTRSPACAITQSSLTHLFYTRLITRTRVQWGDDGCEGIRRCGTNPKNVTACPARELPPTFTDYDAIANASWLNNFSDNTPFTCEPPLSV
jgi:hypothetical protein